VVSVFFALLTAVFNGTASVLQRRAAATAPPEKALHVALLAYLVKHKVWLFGIVMTILAALAQATALATGPVALVQPIFIIELPFTLLVASMSIGRRLPRLTWAAVAIVTVSLGIGLAAAAPSGGSDTAGTQEWIKALVVTAVFEFILITIGVKTNGNARAAAFGLAAACGYALTAALMKNAMAALNQGAVPFFTSWQLYATAAAGVGSLFILQNSLQAGSLIATQPALTLGDALISVSYGVTLFGENLRTGGWLIIEIAAVLAIGFGCIELSRSLGIIERTKPTPQNPNPTLENA
jgi:drug/metabolite transporter (DMT)-like permease